MCCVQHVTKVTCEVAKVMAFYVLCVCVCVQMILKIKLHRVIGSNTLAAHSVGLGSLGFVNDKGEEGSGERYACIPPPPHTYVVKSL